jgi:hypothetical protein
MEHSQREALRNVFSHNRGRLLVAAKRALSDPHARCQSSLLLLAVALTQGGAASDSTATPFQTER